MDTSKIIKGVVNSGRYTVTAPIVKEDYGLYLQIEGVELPSTYEVDFSNSENSGTSVTMIGNADGVLIPHQFIDSGKDVFAFLYHVGADFGRTVYKFRIPNKVRPDRTNEEPTPEEQSVIDQAISALNEAVAQTAQDVIDADASAQSASADAGRAETAKDDASTFAQRSANSAQASADYSASAQASATASAQSASQSAQIKADVEDLADDAQTSASASAQSATASANSASQASASATSAIQASSNASDMALSAQTYSEIAQSHATQAGQSAQTASTKASEASQSATNASQSAQTAEQAKTASQTAQGLAESARDSAVSAKTDAESAKADAESARDEAQQAVASISGALDDKADIITDTASGSIASFSDGADNLPLKSLVVNINPVQDLHGQESPYPAGGGKNLFNGTFLQGYWAYANGAWISDTKWIATEKIPCKPSTYYTASADNRQTRWQGFVYYDNNGDYISSQNLNNKVPIGYTAQTPTNAAYLIFNIAGESGTLDPISPSDVTHFQLEEGQTATSYAPYSNICPISGWDAIKEEYAGKNLFNANDWDHSGITQSDKFIVVSDNSIQLMTTGYMENGNSYVFGKARPKTFSFKTRTIATNGNDPAFSISHVREDGTVSALKRVSLGTTVGNEQKFTINIPTNGTSLRFGNWAYTGTILLYDMQMEFTDATPYEPYTGRSITIDLGQTVYGGKLDVLSGELVVDTGYYMPPSDITLWYGGYGGYYYRITDADFWINDTNHNKMACDVFKVLSDRATMGVYGLDNVVYFPRTNGMWATVQEFVAYAANNVHLVLPLATPITVQLTPNQINSLYGVNNIWADSGDTEVEYRADTKLYISKKIAEAISALS